MTRIREWLGSLGLEKYATLFEQAEIDTETLPHLTEADLNELGLPIGPRRKVLAAAVAFRLPTARKTEDPASQERRHVTVMFVDMVGSTHLSVHTDPEILGGLLKTFKETISAQILQMGGTVTKYLGDGVLACFGWPVAKEDAAERAIRCGLDVIAHIQRIPAPGGGSLHCRIGLATGLLLMGETGGDTLDDGIAGEALNLAARLLGVAAPDSMAMDDRTRRLVAQIFDCQDLGEYQLAGFDTAVQAWRPTAVAAEQDRFTATRQIKTTLVGRAAELAILHQRWADSCRNEGSAVVIAGEAGIGKSRVCGALREQAKQTQHVFVLWQCSAYHQTNALYPVIDYLTRAADFNDTDLPAERLRKLSGLLTRAQIPLQPSLPILADLLSIPPISGYIAPNLRPEQRKATLIAELSNIIFHLAETNPLLLLLEDSHWIDATTLELMTRLLQTVTDAKMLILITVRPDFALPWIGLPQLATLGLRRLDDRQCEDLVREMDATRGLPQSTVQQIVKKCDGNPLFLEEMSLAVLEAKIADAQHVPDSLQSSLMSRLDQLGEAKLTAQICAVLGRRFARPLLAEIAELDPRTLDGNLALLVTRGIIHPLGRSSDGRYEFKHALLRDAAYNSLLLSHRKRLHEACARKLETHFPDAVQAEPELLAYHFAHAGIAAKAADYAEQAGDRAADGFSFSEAIANYREAARNNALSPAGGAREARTLELLLKLGPALGIINGPQDPEMRKTYVQAAEISEALADSDSLFKANWGLWYSANISREFEQAAVLANRLVTLSARSASDIHVLEAYHCRWSSGAFKGEYVPASADAERGLALYDPTRHHRPGIAFGGHDPGVCACGVRGWTLALMGHGQAGLARAQAGVELAEQLSHVHSLAHALQNHITAAAIAQDCAAVEQSTEHLAELAERFNFPPLKSVSRFMQAWAESQTGDPAAGIDRMTAEFSRTVSIGPMPLFHTALYADAQRKAGKIEETLAIIGQALPGVRQDVGFYISELYRIRGECLHMLGRPMEAKRELQSSAAIADKQGAQLLKLRTAASLLRLASESGERALASAALREQLRLMPAISAGPDFSEAEALLSI